MAMYSSSMATAFLLHFVRIAAGLTVRPHCQASCGSVDVPYPFGIGADCFLPGFEIVCLNGDSPVLTGTAHLSIQVLRLSVTPRPEALVTLRVAHQCYNSAGNVTDSYNGTVDLGQSSRVYRISDTANELFVLGCNTFVYTNSGYLRSENDFAHNAGCVATCVDSGSASDGACAGIGCCHVDIPPDLTDNRMYFTADDDDWSHAEQDYSPCDYAFIVERGNYTFRKDDLTSMPLDKAMPLRLDWAIRDEKGSSRSMSCAKAPVEAGYRCVSDHSVCVNSTNGPGYVCNCTQGYEGNPYLTHGCTNIDECAHPTKYPCDGVCKDTQGSYLCYCHPGYGTDDPRTQRCTPKFPLAAQICIGTIGGILVIAFMAFVIVIRKERQKMREFYEKNGGLTLEKGKFIKLFKKEELKPILKSGNVIGKGGFGEVYKGVVDNELVAVKKPIRGNVRENMQFANEVIIQSQVIHKNIVRLIGCCLEVDAPMLVYEFISKGSMDDILHRADNKELLSLDVRLNILAESAHGLAYMHSQAHTKILHGDVKPANILLDDNFVPKISDFGISRLIAIDNEHTANVIGDMTYMDPVYVQTGRLTEKSDVYSFGIVILEVISRKKATHSDNNSLVTSFLECHKEGKRATELFDKEIAATGDLELLDTLAKIAVDCLNLDVDQRPSMTDVVVRLLSILNRSRMT